MYLWEIDQDEPLYSRLCHRNEIWTIAVHPSGDRFATGSSDGEVHVWNIADGSRTGAPLSHEGLISSCRFDDSGQWLAAASRGGTVAVWSTDDLAQSPQLLRHRAAVTSCSFAPGGNRLLTTDRQGGATMWQLDAGRFIKKWHEEFGSYVLTYGQFSPDGSLVVVCGARASSYQWRPNNGVIFLLDSETATKVSPTMHHLRRVQRVHFSAAGDALVSGSLDYDCRVWAIEPVLMDSPDLSHFIQVLSGHVVDERSRVVSVDAGSQEQLFEQLQRVQPELFRNTASQIESWTAHVQHVKRVSAPQLTPDERDQ